MIRFWQKPKIEFLCDREHFGAIAKPVPAQKALPGWYKSMSPGDHGGGVYTVTGIFTMKKCVPVLDAMSLGWIVPIPVDIAVTISHDGKDVRTASRYPASLLVTSHVDDQLRGSPWHGRPVLKLHTLWNVWTSPGWSTLFTRPFNTTSGIEPFTAVVDTDTYHSLIVPICLNLPDGVYTLAKGAPLVQAIPFRREKFASSVRASTDAERKVVEVTGNAVLSQPEWYRRFAWHRSKKEG